MAKFYVIATVWSEEKRRQTQIVKGEFSTFFDATLFKDAYNKYYKADAYVVDEDTLLNADGGRTMAKTFIEPFFQLGDGVRFKNNPLTHGEVVFVGGHSGDWHYQIKYLSGGHWYTGWFDEDEIMI